jgi:hypothetical protein
MDVAMSFIDNSSYRSFRWGRGGWWCGWGEVTPPELRAGRARAEQEEEEVGGGSAWEEHELDNARRSIKNIGKNLHHITK